MISGALASTLIVGICGPRANAAPTGAAPAPQTAEPKQEAHAVARKDANANVADEAATAAASPLAAASDTAPIKLKSAIAPEPPRAIRALVPAGPPPKLMPVSEVKPGMVGEAFTVFSGTKPEPFKVRVVSIVQNFLPQQDVILVKAEDPRVAFSGIAAGMSGSPVYIDGRLIGAVAYAWSFAKEPLAGVTPIETMLAERDRPRRGTRDELKAGDLVTGPMPAIARDPGDGTRPSLHPVGVPLAVSGLTPAALSQLEEALSPYGIVPVRAGGGGGPSRLPPADQNRLMPGSAVGVLLIRGDMNATAMGTVTWVSGNSVLAFGHPMFGNGEVSLPMVTGQVHTFISSQASSFKLATPLAEIGTVVQDRPSCIVGDLSLRAPMMPVTVRVNAPGMAPRTFRAEVARAKRLAPALAAAVLSSAIAGAEPDQADMAVSLSTKVGLRGLPPVEMRDETFSGEGLSPRLLANLRGVRALGEIINNPFEPVGIERLDFDVNIVFRKDYAEIVGVSLPGDVVEAGGTVPLRVTLRPFAGREYVETISVPIPESLAGKQVRVEVASGASVRPDVARPEDLPGFINALKSYYTASSIVVSLSLPEDGVSLRGKLLPNLPPSALDTLRTARGTRRAESYRIADRIVIASNRPVAGRQDLVLDVRSDPLGRRVP
jgi:SpoIVB peptidase S55